MFGTPKGRRLRTVAVAASLIGAVLATNIAQANITQPGRDAGHDPHAYTDPYAGFVAPQRGTGRLAPATGALLGTHSTDSASDPLDREHQWIMQTEETAGRRMDIDNSYYGEFSEIADDFDPANPNKTGLNKLAFWDIEMGRIPLVGWGCGESSEIAAGKHDATIRKTAQAMKAFKHEFFMRYCWEMDGNKRTSEVGKPEVFVQAWVRMWKLFQEEGATNVVWVWCANANTFKHPNDQTGSYAWDYYPGDEYVDWVSADGYNWGASDRNDNLSKDRWRGFVEIFDEFMVWARSTGPIPQAMIDDFEDIGVTEFPRKRAVKPIMIGEYGVQEPTGSIREKLHEVATYNDKETWLRETHDTVNGSKPRTAECPWCGIYSDIAAMVYFDIVGVNGPWIINSSEASKAAYREAGQDPWFNQISTIGWGPASVRPDYVTPTPTPTPAPADPGPAQPPVSAPGATTSGYWMLGADGKMYPFGEAKGHGDASKALEAAPAGVAASDVEPSPTGAGYWVIDSAGKVHAFGDAAHFGDADAAALAAGEKVTSISATPTGAGYWLFTTRGRAISKGDAGDFGDVSELALASPVLDSIPTPSGKGYYMVAGDGGIFAFGDARFHGSMGSTRLNAPVQSLVPTPDGNGYWLVASDGGIFAFGNAPFRGSMGATKLNKPVTGMVQFGNGYLMVGEDGGVFNFSDQAFAGSLGGVPLSRPIVAIAALR